MQSHLARDLENLKREILRVGGLVESAIQKATTALLDSREDLVEEVLRGDAEIDRVEVAIEEECLKILALHQPVASDLRFLIAVLKVNNDLERMGDLAQNIAERARSLRSDEPLPISASLEKMVDGVQHMVRSVLNALVTSNADEARRVRQMDDEIDRINAANFVDIEQLMRSDASLIGRGIAVLSVSRNLERIADQATNIAEDIIFMVDGEIHRHRLVL